MMERNALLLKKTIAASLVLGVLTLAAGCTSQPTKQVDPVAAEHSTTATAACIETLSNENRTPTAQLDVDSIRLVNWNIRKGLHPDWFVDLESFHDTADILALQEASPDFPVWEKLTPGHHRSFAQGYRGFGQNTGVMTLSTVAPVAECDLVEHEPWLKTPKAMLVTTYRLAETDSTLLVINIHGINFSVGMRELERQMTTAARIIAAHQGPVLFTGDFNTWRSARTALIENMVDELGLEPVQYTNDHRKRFFGWPLDHIFVRGLETLSATTYAVDSSDHNPMLVEFRLDKGGLAKP